MQGIFLDKNLYAIQNQQDNNTVVLDVDSNSITLSNLSISEIIENADFSPFYYDKIERNIPKEVERDIDYVIVGVAETCNLRCTYCYAESGTYGQSNKKIMSFEELKDMLSKLLEISPKGIKTISFFGGEPLMGFHSIKEFVVYANQFLPEHGIRIPQWGIVTNGTLLTDEMIEFFGQHNFSVNVSLDGPKEINDLTRIYADTSKSVFDVVEKNLKKIKKHNFNLCCQSTLNKDFFMKYEKGGYEKFIRSMYALGYDYVAPLIAQCDETATLDQEFEAKIEVFYKDMIDYDFELLMSGNRLEEVNASTLTIIDRFTKQQYHLGCCAGSESIYYSAQGKFYKCHLFYELGDENITEQDLKNIDKIPYTDKTSYTDCQLCMAKNICFSWCPGSDKLLKGKHDEGSCLAQKVSVEQVILKLANITENPMDFEKFSKNYKMAAERSANAVNGVH